MFFTEKRKGKDKDKDTGIGIGIGIARARANGSVFIGLLFMLLFFAVIILAYPKYFLFLFQSIFGILLLSVFVIGIGYVDVRWAIGMALFFIILYLTLHLASSKKEPFEQQGQVWTQQTIDKFKSYQQMLIIWLKIINGIGLQKYSKCILMLFSKTILLVMILLLL